MPGVRRLSLERIEMKRQFGVVPPYRLLIIHTALILAFMFTLSQRLFLTDIPYDCFYLPFFIVSGPIVYFIAHTVQHASEVFFTPDQVMLAWNVVPGTVCLIMGGLQWWAVESFFVGMRKKRRTLMLP
jgi:hypothetical protein